MSDIHQLIKKSVEQSKEYKNIFPWTYTESVKDRETGEILDESLARFNFYYLAYAGSDEATRLQLSSKYRKQGCVIGYMDYNYFFHIDFYINQDIRDTQWKMDSNWIPLFSFYNGYFTLPWKGNFADTVLLVNKSYRHYGTVVTYKDANMVSFMRYNSYEIDDLDWSNEANWTGLNWETIQEWLKDIVEEILSNLEDYPDIYELIKNLFTDIVNNLLSEGMVEDIVNKYLEGLNIGDMVHDQINNWFDSEEGTEFIKNLVNQYLQENLEPLVGEFFTAVVKYLQDNERVIANALARHEQAITDLQNT